jgi:hypothetical protein
VPKLPRLPKKDKEQGVFDPDRGPMWSPRFIVALVLILGGIAWIAYYYLGVRPTDGWGSFNAEGEPNAATGPKFMRELAGWNYLIGFGLLMLGLVISAHPSTPLGRGRGVIVGMLGCFVIGIVWICIYYVVGTGDNPDLIPVFNDLAQKNLIVGIGFMAVGFTFATRWE